MNDDSQNLPNLESTDILKQRFRRHAFSVTVNETYFSEVWIDSHYEENHGGSMTDELILKLVALLDHNAYRIEQVVNGYEWYAEEFELEGKAYKMIWLIPPDQSYVGVRTAFRRSI